jgi:hypothetical protein
VIAEGEVRAKKDDIKKASLIYSCYDAPSVLWGRRTKRIYIKNTTLMALEETGPYTVLSPQLAQVPSDFIPQERDYEFGYRETK